MKSESNIDQNDDFDFYGDAPKTNKDFDDNFKTISTMDFVKDDITD